jgi:hypothetical protein
MVTYDTVFFIGMSRLGGSHPFAFGEVPAADERFESGFAKVVDHSVVQRNVRRRPTKRERPVA